MSLRNSGYRDGKQEGIEVGRQEGREAGRREQAEETAKKLIKENIDIKIIERVTGLTESEIKKLKEEIL